MPLQRCESNGVSGWKWGDRGRCYVGDDAKQRAVRQGIAIEGPETVRRILRGSRQLEDLEARLLDPEWWEREIRPLIMRRVLPRLREAFMVGAELGSMQRPARAKAIGLRQEAVLPFDFEAISTAADEAIATYSDTWWRQFSASTQRGLRRAVQRSREQGLGPDAVAREIAPLFGEQRARLIAVSEMTTVLGQGAQATYRRAGFPEWEWRTVRDASVDPICRDLDRERFPADVTFERAHPGCLVPTQHVEASAIEAVARRFYDGPIVTIQTALGRKFTVTPNHPVATPAGWFAAADLDVGRDVLSYARGIEWSGAQTPDDVGSPAAISEVFEALRGAVGVAAVSMPTTPKDFHGDGGDGDVDVVGTDGPLRMDSQSETAEHIGQANLERRWRALVLEGQRAQEHRSLSERSIFRSGVGGLNLLRPLGFRHTSPAQSVRLGGVAQLHAGLLQSIGYGEARYAEATSQLIGTGAALVGGTEYGEVDLYGWPRDVATAGLAIQRGAGYAAHFCDLIDRVSTRVALDRVVELRVGQFRGHVYNIQTVSGWYTANSIIVSNCRCWPVPAGEPSTAVVSGLVAAF